MIGTSRQHGTESRYTYGCRCVVCVAGAAATRADREARRQLGEIRVYVRSSRKHGTASRYVSGCRCQKCRAARAAYQREWYARKKAAQS